MRLGTACIALAIVAGSPAFAQGGRYELVPEPDVRQTSTNRAGDGGIEGNRHLGIEFIAALNGCGQDSCRKRDQCRRQ